MTKKLTTRAKALPFLCALFRGLKPAIPRLKPGATPVPRVGLFRGLKPGATPVPRVGLFRGLKPGATPVPRVGLFRGLKPGATPVPRVGLFRVVFCVAQTLVWGLPLSFSSGLAYGQNIEGQIIASQYGHWRVPGYAANTYSSFAPGSCRVQGGASFFFAFTAGTPVSIVDANPYTKGGEYDQTINQGLTNVSDAGANSLQGALQSQARRTGQNSAADAATAAAGAQQNTRNLSSDLAGAQQNRIAGEAGYNQAALGASATPISANQALYGTSANAADATLGDETQAAKTPGFWDEVGNSVAGNLGAGKL